MAGYSIRPATREDGPWVDALMRERWGGEVVVTRGRVLTPSELRGFLAETGRGPAGLVTYEVRGSECEVVTLDSLEERTGIGSALMAAAEGEARAAGCRRLWLITTNDNTRALRFYQKLGFTLAALHRGAIAESRKLKPSIALVGEDGIPIRDEIELEKLLANGER
jgi:ribosomal protein S18 acetylase RimI-like enzyme